jgi:hypothetical protein
MMWWMLAARGKLSLRASRAARTSQRGRDNVTHLPIRQQQIFESGAGLPPIDLGEIWTELGMSPRA